MKNLGMRLIKFFLVGMLLHFLVHTFVSFKLGFDGSLIQVVWAWKEIYIAGGLVYVLYNCMYTDILQRIWSNSLLRIALCLLVGTSIIFIVLTLGVQDLSIHRLALAIRYDLLGFMIFFIALGVGLLSNTTVIRAIINRYGSVMKWVLVLAVFWRLVILIKPGALQVFFGYDKNIHEGVVGAAPPAVYYTQERYGYTRNQFVFERPIHFGFWLVAMWPLFFYVFLYRRSFGQVWGWWLLYGYNIAITFSRAARGSWLIVTVLLLALSYRKQFVYIFLRALLPLILVVASILYMFPRNLIQREYSTTGHVAMVLQLRDMFTSHIWSGYGAASAGPGSHHLSDGQGFNPENQFLQVLVEFGLLGGGPWIVLFARFVLSAIPSAKKLYQEQNGSNKKQEADRRRTAMALGMVGLAISGMALHSFVDRMIVYPYMTIYGLIVAYYLHDMKYQSESTKKIEKKPR